jgi:hypothetical protein
VRPKSREETPKEGSETSDRSHRSRPIYLYVRRTKYKGLFALQKGGAGMAVFAGAHDQRPVRAECGHRQKKGPLEDERPKSREETPKVGYDTSQMCR